MLGMDNDNQDTVAHVTETSTERDAFDDLMAYVQSMHWLCYNKKEVRRMVRKSWKNFLDFEARVNRLRKEKAKPKGPMVQLMWLDFQGGGGFDRRWCFLKRWFYELWEPAMGNKWPSKRLIFHAHHPRFFRRYIAFYPVQAWNDLLKFIYPEKDANLKLTDHQVGYRLRTLYRPNPPVMVVTERSSTEVTLS